jgi:hypothetical protein
MQLEREIDYWEISQNDSFRQRAFCYPKRSKTRDL